MEAPKPPAVPELDEAWALAEALRDLEASEATSVPGYVTLELDAEAFLASLPPQAGLPALELDEEDVCGPGYVTLELNLEALPEASPWQASEPE